MAQERCKSTGTPRRVEAPLRRFSGAAVRQAGGIANRVRHSPPCTCGGSLDNTQLVWAHCRVLQDLRTAQQPTSDVFLILSRSHPSEEVDLRCTAAFHPITRLRFPIAQSVYRPNWLSIRVHSSYIPRIVAGNESINWFPKMRTTLLLLPAAALAASDFASNFSPAQLAQSPAQSNETLIEAGLPELLRRQTNPNECADGYNPCSNINQPGLCCPNDNVCSMDSAGHAACCPVGSACTGTIAPATQGSSPTGTQSTTGTPTAGAATTTIIGNPNPTESFVQGSGASATSWVPNTFFPFAYLPTTYTAAAACSSAYSRCQSDAARCTAALAGGQNFGVTVSAPNGGVTITAVPSLGSASASSICSSLSSAACSGDWNVAACSAYGGDGSGAQRRCGDVYKMGAGVAIGVVGQMLR